MVLTTACIKVTRGMIEWKGKEWNGMGNQLYRVTRRIITPVLFSVHALKCTTTFLARGVPRLPVGRQWLRLMLMLMLILMLKDKEDGNLYPLLHSLFSLFSFLSVISINYQLSIIMGDRIGK